MDVVSHRVIANWQYNTILHLGVVLKRILRVDVGNVRILMETSGSS